MVLKMRLVQPMAIAYLERIDQTDALKRAYGGEDDDSHRAGSDQRRRSEGQKNAHAPLHGDDHGQTARAEQTASN